MSSLDSGSVADGDGEGALRWPSMRPDFVRAPSTWWHAWERPSVGHDPQIEGMLDAETHETAAR
jgi:hypothetical protein